MRLEPVAVRRSPFSLRDDDVPPVTPELDPSSSLSTTLPMIPVIVRRGVPPASCAVLVGLERSAVVMIDGGDIPVVAPAPVLRLAYVGTVQLRDRHGHTVRSRRFASAAGESASSVIERLMLEIADATYERPDLQIAIVQDGTEDGAWTMLRTAITDLVGGPANDGPEGRWLEAIDRNALHRRLARILELLEGDPAVRSAELVRWAWRFDLTDTAVDELLAELDAELERQPASLAAALSGHRRFFRAQRERMRYVALRLAGVVLHAPCVPDDRSPPRRIRRTPPAGTPTAPY
jgi:hypothetical protein